MGHLTFDSAGAVPLGQHCSFVRHSFWCMPCFDSSESASTSRLLWSVGFTLSVEGLQQRSSSFAQKAKPQVSRSGGATVCQEGRVPTEAYP